MYLKECLICGADKSSLTDMHIQQGFMTDLTLRKVKCRVCKNTMLTRRKNYIFYGIPIEVPLWMIIMVLSSYLVGIKAIGFFNFYFMNGCAVFFLLNFGKLVKYNYDCIIINEDESDNNNA